MAALSQLLPACLVIHSWVGWAKRLTAHPAIDRALAARELSCSWARHLCAWTGRLPSSARDGAGHAEGALTPGCAHALTTVLEALGKKAGPEDTRTAGQRRHDALEEAWGWTLRLHADGTTTAASPDGSRVFHSHSPPGQAA